MTLLLAISLIAGVNSGNASRYGFAGDVYDRVGSFACQRRLETRFGSRIWEKMRDHGVAHRTLPCGTSIGVCLTRTGQCTTAYVVDRGPWGTLNRNGEWHQRTGRLLPGEYYRGELDLLPGTYTAIGLVGIEKVHFWPILEGGTELPSYEAPRRADFPLLRPAGTGHTPIYPPLRLGDALRSTVTPHIVATIEVAPTLAMALPDTRDTGTKSTGSKAITTEATTEATTEVSSLPSPPAMPPMQLVSAERAVVYPTLRLAGYAANQPRPPLRLADASNPEPKLHELQLLAIGPR